MSGANTYSGPTHVIGGTLQSGSNTAFGSNSAVTLDAGTTLNNNSSPTIGSLTGSGNVTLTSGTLTIGSLNTSTSYAGVISGSGALAKTGSGTLTLAGTNTYTGATAINQGTLQAGSTAALGTAAGATTVQTGGVLDLNGFTLGVSEPLTLNNGTLANSSGTGVTYNGAITLSTNPSTVNTTGNITLGSAGITGGQGLTKIGAGTLSLGSGTATIGSLTISAGALTSTSGTLNVAGDFANSATFTHNSGTVIFNGAAQAITTNGSAFNNVTLGGTLTKTLNDVTTFNNLTINTGVVANLGAFAHTASRLTLASTIGATSGTWGSTSSVPLAAHTNDTYFAATAGYITVSIDNCTAFNFAVSSVPNICEGATSFVINYTGTAGSPDQYSISGTGISTVTNGALGASITVNLTAPAVAGGPYSFTLTVRNSIGQCVSGNITNPGYTVGAVPANPDPPTSNSPQCADVGVTLTSATNLSGDTWYWQGTTSLGTSIVNSTGTYNTNTSSPAPTGGSPYTIYIRARNGAGCWSTGQASLVVTVNPTPVAPNLATITNPAPAAQCANVGVTLNSGGTPVGYTAYWQGTTPLGTSTANSNSSYNTKTDFPNGVSGTYYLRTQSNAGCWAATAASATVTINPVPSSVSATPNSLNVCSGGALGLTGAATVIPNSVLTTALSENFNGANFAATNFSLNAGGSGSTPFALRADGFSNNGVTWHSNTNDQFVMGFVAAFTSGSVNSVITTTNAINTTGYTDLKMSYWFSYKQGGSGSGTVEVSDNGDAGPWTVVKTHNTPTSGTVTTFTNSGDIDLSTHINKPNFKIRFNLVGSAGGFTNYLWWAIDNLLVNGNKLNSPQFIWSSAISGAGADGLLASHKTPNYSAANGNISINPTTVSALTQVTYTVTAKNPISGCTASASTASAVNINPKATVPTQNTSVCSGGTFTLTPTGGNLPTTPGTLYTWAAVAETANVFAGQASGSPAADISQTLSLKPGVTTDQNVSFLATPHTGSCDGTAFTVNVTVKASPVLTPQNTSTCSGTAFNITPSGTPANTTYYWLDPPVITPNPGDLTGGSNQLTETSNISQTLTNTTNTDATAVYTVTPQSGISPNVCQGEDFTVTVTVHPKPVIGNYAPAAACSGSFSVTPANAVAPAVIVPAGTMYTWTVPANTLGATNQPVAQSSIGQTLTNSGTSVQSVVYTVTPIGPDCTGSTFTITVTVNPDNKISSATSGAPTVCPSGSTLLTANGVTNFNSSVDWYTAPGGGGTHVGGPYSGSGSVAGPTLGAGTYYARVTGNCGAAAEQSVVVGTTTYTLTASAGAGGSISDPGATVVNCESGHSYTITPNAGFAIQDVVVSGIGSVGAVSNYSFTNVTANQTITASFVSLSGADYRSFSSGNFSVPGNWEFYNGSTWVYPATQAPGNGNNINIRNGHDMVLDMNLNVGSGKTLLMDATSSLVVNPNRTLAVSGTATLNGQSVVFKSDATGTASLGSISGSISGETNVTVERYLPTAGVPTGRSWRLLTIPVTSATKTIRDAWAGHAANGNAPAGESGGSGTQITGTAYGDGTTASNAGYDWWTAIAYTASSIRSYTISGSNGGWYQTPLTSVLLDNADQGYMLFVRGDRTVTTGSGPTTLRPNGKIKTGLQGYNFPAPATAKYKVIGNPYAATISFESLMTNGNNSIHASDDHFWQWDANINTNGAYRLVQKLGAGNWIRIPAAFSDPSPSHSEYISSSQAFVIEALTATTPVTDEFTIDENDKPAVLAGTPPSVFDASTAGRFYANLNMDNGGGSLSLSDGVLATFDGSGNNGIDGKDIDKIDNFNENISLVRNNRKLTLEARNLISSNAGSKDTLYFQMSNLAARNYAFQFKGVQMQNGLTAKLQDLYLGKETVISTAGDITTVNFSVTSDASSGAADRFRIVFKADPSLPLTLTSAKAYSLNNGVQVDWKTVNERGVKNYEVEKSVDGRSFAKATSVTAQNGAANSYGWYDAAPVKGNNYYRIKSIGTSGETSFSQVLVVNLSGGRSAFTIYPNPVKGNRITLQLSNMEKGKYAMTVYNAAGQRVISRDITHLGGSATEEIDLGSALASGVYRVSFSSHNGATLNQTLVVQR